MTQNVIVISASQYVIKNDKTGEVENTGTTVRFVFSENLAPKEDIEKKVKGYKPAKITLTYDDYSMFPTVPALYEAEIDFSVDSQGKAAIAAKNFKFLSEISVKKASAKGGFPAV
ncbi:MAG: hypothetical protein LBD23_01225 [Oscillospiraceae bacterium]|jgi:hypothetical protein|nr:hypothetical protein [Oscillospiraceae bacterium]